MCWRSKNKDWQGNVRVVRITNADNLPVAANENCFWKWVLGAGVPFRVANWMRRRRLDLIRAPNLLPSDRVRLIENCEVYLELFKAVHVEGNTALAEALAPKINRHMPDLMTRCPIKELRPSRDQLIEFERCLQEQGTRSTPEEG